MHRSSIVSSAVLKRYGISKLVSASSPRHACNGLIRANHGFLWRYPVSTHRLQLQHRALHDESNHRAQNFPDGHVLELDPPRSLQDITHLVEDTQPEAPPPIGPDGPTEDLAHYAGLLDPYLPSDLRLHPGDPSEHRPARDLLLTLHNLRQDIPTGALGTLVPKLARWESFVYLAKAIASFKPGSMHRANQETPFLTQSPWSRQSCVRQAEGGLERLLEEPLKFIVEDNFQHTATSLEESSEALASGDNEELQHLHQKAMGEVWLTLGRIVIEADRASDPDKLTMMDQVYDVEGYLHSHDHVPTSIYEYDPDTVPLPRRKPPYLHVMSSRMITTLSDARWRRKEQEFTGASSSQETFSGSTDFGPPKLPIHSLRPNLWLEFILWCCATNGHFLEAGALLAMAFPPKAVDPWTALSWQDVLKMQTDHHKRHQSWFDQVASLAEGYSENKPLIEMPPRSISLEVVHVVFNGLVARAHESANSRRLLNSTFTLLVDFTIQSSSDSKLLEVNSAVNQVSDLADVDTTAISVLWDDAHMKRSDEEPATASVALTDDDDSETIAKLFAQDSEDSIRHSLVVALDEYVFQGLMPQAETLFERLQNAAQNGKNGHADALVVTPQMANIPHTTIAQYLDLAMRTDHFDTARELLYKSGLIPQSAAGNQIYQPVLLRAALAFSDHLLLSSTLKSFNIGLEKLPNDILEALLEAEIRTARFDKPGSILRHLAEKRGLAPSPRLITLLAVKLLDDPVSAEMALQNKKAATLLRQILGRMYVPPQNPARPRDYTVHREISQLARIFASTGGQLGEVAAEFAEVANDQLASPVPIDAAAFNVLLEAVARTRNWQMAQRLFERWCSFDAYDRDKQAQLFDGLPAQRPRFGGEERVVTPNVASVQAAMWAVDLDRVLKTFHRSLSFRKMLVPTPTEPKLLRWDDVEDDARSREWRKTPLPIQVRWAVEQYQRMGLSDEEIEGLIPRLTEHWSAP